MLIDDQEAPRLTATTVRFIGTGRAAQVLQTRKDGDGIWSYRVHYEGFGALDPAAPPAVLAGRASESQDGPGFWFPAASFVEGRVALGLDAGA